jgi:hypothetical protein
VNPAIRSSRDPHLPLCQAVGWTCWWSTALSVSMDPWPAYESRLT